MVFKSRDCEILQSKWVCVCFIPTCVFALQAITNPTACQWELFQAILIDTPVGKLPWQAFCWRHKVFQLIFVASNCMTTDWFWIAKKSFLCDKWITEILICSLLIVMQQASRWSKWLETSSISVCICQQFDHPFFTKAFTHPTAFTLTFIITPTEVITLTPSHPTLVVNPYCSHYPHGAITPTQANAPKALGHYCPSHPHHRLTHSPSLQHAALMTRWDGTIRSLPPGLFVWTLLWNKTANPFSHVSISPLSSGPISQGFVGNCLIHLWSIKDQVQASFKHWIYLSIGEQEDLLEHMEHVTRRLVDRRHDRRVVLNCDVLQSLHQLESVRGVQARRRFL